MPLREYPGAPWILLVLRQGSKVVDNLIALIDEDPSGLTKLQDPNRDPAQKTAAATRKISIIKIPVIIPITAFFASAGFAREKNF